MTQTLFDRFVKLSYKISHLDDEEWEYSEEPHVKRRVELLKKYPEIKKLMGYDPTIAFIVTAEVLVQIFMCYLIQDAGWGRLLLASYVIGASLNHSLGSAIHEIGHNLAFGHTRPLWNRALGMLCNLPMAIPMSVTYKRYHTDHHRYLGHEQLDVDIPTHLESKLFQHWFTRMIWLLIHPALHAFRPYYKSFKAPNTLEIINMIVVLSFDAAIYFVFGHKAFFYLFIGTLFGLGFHPLAGHFISEHYLFYKGQATMSYYGPLNPILFNVGYHIEHHDFPYIPYRRLPELRKIAPEYYNKPHHTSWLKVLWDYIFDPDMGPQSHGVGYKKEVSNGSVTNYAEAEDLYYDDINDKKSK